MSDQELHNNQTELIARYLSGQATDAEVQQLEQWVAADPEHRQQFMVLKKAWVLTGVADDREPVDVDSNWDRVSADLFGKGRVVDLPTKRPHRPWLRVAATVALLVTVAVWAWWQFGQEQELYVAAADQVRTLALPDGSTVTLNRASTLRYLPVRADRQAGTSAQREVVLEGDAFFDVVREPERPFRIQSGALEIEVLGTSFYVDARAVAEEIQVIVATGTVRVSAGQADAVTLQAGEKSIYEKAAQRLRQETNTDANFASIRTDTLRFDNSTLEEVTFALSRHYRIPISYTGIENTGNCELDGTYVDYSLEEIMAVLEAAWGIEIVQENGQLLFSGAGCNER